MPPYIPPELVSLIIAEVPDKDALAACTLVSHAWKTLARPQQFRTLNYCVDADYVCENSEWMEDSEDVEVDEDDSQADEEDDVEVVEQDVQVDEQDTAVVKKQETRPWSAFADFVKSSPHIMKLVHSLVIAHGGDPLEWDETSPLIDFNDAVALLPYLPNLANLDVASHGLDVPPTRTDPWSFRRESVRTVRVGLTWEHYPVDFVPKQVLFFMLPFTGSREIVLTSLVMRPKRYLPKPDSFRVFDVLEVLSLRGIKNIHSFLPTLGALSTCFPALRRLELGHVVPRGQARVWNVLNDFRCQLTHLTLQHNYTEEFGVITAYPPTWHLPPFAKLESVRFIIPSTYHWIPDWLELRAWQHSLSTLPATPLPALSQVVFEHSDCRIRWMDSEVARGEVKDVERQLLQLPGLQEVRFETSEESERWRSRYKFPTNEPLVEWFPELHSRGILQVS